ncbi:hypothetical protein BpHYR1_025706 [Brachionus plicatilis]|uniref:Uncharacterized protein n=1 Tax=Brachionus plicatilis TaxID=10195 RepID=A0A3M7RFU8_BRAPC|nr:hypothetical protein BpHYR1_025706 [Brachionus plicatilis]
MAIPNKIPTSLNSGWDSIVHGFINCQLKKFLAHTTLINSLFVFELNKQLFSQLSRIFLFLKFN